MSSNNASSESSPLTYTPLSEIPAAYETVQATFASGVTRSIEWRKAQIKQLGFLVQDNEEQFVEALKKDLNRPAFETLTAEINPFKAEVNEALANVKTWATPTGVKTTLLWMGAGPKVYSEPKGALRLGASGGEELILLAECRRRLDRRDLELYVLSPRCF